MVEEAVAEAVRSVREQFWPATGSGVDNGKRGDPDAADAAAAAAVGCPD